MRIFLLIAFFFQCCTSFSQKGSSLKPVVADSGYNSLGQKYTVQKPSSFYITGNARDWVSAEKSKTLEVEHNKFSHSQKKTTQQISSPDPNVQTSYGTQQLSPPLLNFDGQLGDAANPPVDPSGAAGPNHYVQAVNYTFQVFDKTGNALTTPVGLSFFGGLAVVGDPIVMYDRHADRWIIACLKAFQNVIISVSQTNDPTGAYYTYNYAFTYLPDYPKFSVWWDGYYMTANTNITQNAVVFDRTQMLAGNPSAQMIALSLPSMTSMNIISALPSDADGPLPPNGTPCNFFLLEDDGGSAAIQDQIKIYSMTTDWITPASTQLNVTQQLPITPFNGSYPSETIPQPGTTQRLDGMEGIFMYRAQHRRWLGYNTIVLAHTVDIGANTAIRWYELRDHDDNVWYQYQYGTYMPDAANRWVPGIAMDDYGSIALAFAYCDSANNEFAGIRYTGRLASDTLGQMTFAEEIAKQGSRNQTASNRFGDYSALTIDPDGSTFWHTSEYLAVANNTNTRIYTFKLDNVAGFENLIETVSLAAAYSGTELSVNVKKCGNDEVLTLEVIGMDGRVITFSNQKPTQGSLNYSFENLSLSGGIYFVRLSNSKFQKTVRVLVSG